jgi:hypothetical protein
MYLTNINYNKLVPQPRLSHAALTTWYRVIICAEYILYERMRRLREALEQIHSAGGKIDRSNTRCRVEVLVWACQKALSKSLHGRLGETERSKGRMYGVVLSRGRTIRS